MRGAPDLSCVALVSLVSAYEVTDWSLWKRSPAPALMIFDNNDINCSFPLSLQRFISPKIAYWFFMAWNTNGLFVQIKPWKLVPLAKPPTSKTINKEQEPWKITGTFGDVDLCRWFQQKFTQTPYALSLYLGCIFWLVPKRTIFRSKPVRS